MEHIFMQTHRDVERIVISTDDAGMLVTITDGESFHVIEGFIVEGKLQLVQNYAIGG